MLKEEKRLICLILCIALMMSMMPMMVFAQSTSNAAAGGWNISYDEPGKPGWDVSYDEPTVKGFDAKEHGWSFVNGREGFNYDASSYIPAQRYAAVFGDEYVAAATAGGQIYTSMMPTKWGGNCYGMSVTSVLFYLGMLDWTPYDDLYENDFSTVNSYYSTLLFYSSPKGLYKDGHACSDLNTPVTNLIEGYQILQYGTKGGYRTENSTYSEVEKEYYHLSKVQGDQKEYSHSPEGSYISNVLKRIEETDEPLLVSMSGAKGGHAMVIRRDRAVEYGADGWCKVYVYDPNRPYISNSRITKMAELRDYYLNLDYDDTYIEFNPKENKWRYCGSAVAGNAASYWGCSADGEVKTYQYAQNISCPEYMYVYTLTDIGYPTRFDGTEEWKERYRDRLSLVYSDTSNFTVVSKDGKKIAGVTDGVPSIWAEGVEYIPYVGYTEDGSAAGGKLTIPYTDAVVEYLSGDDISLIGQDSVVNLACNGHATVTVSMNSKDVTLESHDSNDILMQISDVSSGEGYTSVYMEGNLESGDAVDLNLTDDRLVVQGDINGSGALDVYTDNETTGQDVFITTIDGGNDSATVPDVRETAKGYSVTGTVASYNNQASVTVTLLADGAALTEMTADTDTYSFESLTPGTYTLEVSKQNHATRTYEITVSDRDVVQDVKLHLTGDINGDGRINVQDVARIYAWVKKTGELSDYEQLCAEVSGDGRINVRDVALVYGHVKKTSSLW